MHVFDILDRLVAFPSVAGRPNGDIAGWIETYLAEHGTQVTVVPGPEGDRSNLFATIGPANVPGYILSGHMDVVPASEPQWSSNPFALRKEGERLYGRGTTDMKGFLAAVLAAVPALARLRLARPIHLAFSYDEEVGCRGVPHLIARLPELCAKPLGVIVGEPSGMRAVRGHKGKAAARVIINGRSGHSSRPDLGLNAIHAMAAALGAAVNEAERLTHGPFDPAFEPPYSSLQAGVVAGGHQVNIIPDTCTLDLEARAILGVDPASLLAPVKARAEALAADGFRIEWTPMSAYPAMSLPPDAPLAGLLHALIGEVPLAAVSYGTEAGLYQAAGLDAIICGPGDIDRAHKPDEYILASELTACQRLIEALGARCAA
ncbi:MULTISPECIES: acetylornithine deacetylase [unclassified Mesorhizobium]|uniref:acetylornithine deacetylase n=1 Tax=unclassified Mesorhizobium TaxID=325217 RepID=UPI000FC9AADA|nr:MULTISPECIES: acetylornithine deacetylase [unclassified Mesorhizobium]RUU81203.1 acetylornithine deacetylase [Mesorhizobium sp. M7A.F.Ca.MR.362.00.0.0]RUV21017.1 acetylornithine deacetylase [Mesorhizobium sp. M7A.F.Ca.MR.245.00.0.0]RUV51882.1 acetylornithine deacetylase [Mesorhizobium sp. M7A.F.Ca.MR.228.00.0.0]RWN96406.1 MAG: acetylornithine deacetylase [Mesorhizobium sp.]